MAGERWKTVRSRWQNHWRLMLGVAVLATTLAAVCLHFDAKLGGLLEEAERTAYDTVVTRFTARREVSSQVVLVTIDQPSLERIRANEQYALNFGSWPYSRNLWARVVEQLEAEGARAIVFDAVMDERGTDESMDLAFAQVLQETSIPFYLGVSTHANAPLLPPADFGAAVVVDGPAQAEDTFPEEAGAETFEDGVLEAVLPSASPEQLEIGRAHV